MHACADLHVCVYECVCIMCVMHSAYWLCKVACGQNNFTYTYRPILRERLLSFQKLKLLLSLVNAVIEILRGYG